MAPGAPGDLRDHFVVVILNIRHNGLRRFHERGERRRVPPQYADRIRRILTALDEATDPRGMDLTGFGLHPLRGDRANFWAVNVSANWRIVFSFDGENVCDVDLVDYH